MNEYAVPKLVTEKAITADAAGWRYALVALLVVLLAILALYRETAQGMVDIWWRSETFAHAFLVPPISLWLIWRLRKTLACLPPRASFLGLVALSVAGFVWFLGELATVSVVSQFALTGMLVAAVPAVLGWTVTRRIVFPLAFLFFAVPFGEFALPQLMEWTANFTILGLRLSGIPVYREGLNFIIPSGRWSVVEACSGVRYLIASFCVGTLYAYLTYRSVRRRLLFVAVAIVVPLIANWLRAYMIVMIGHYSGNTLAVGVDHLIYGWLFFGLVIGVMFWVGSYWREDEAPLPELAAGAVLDAGLGASRAAVALVVLLAIALAAIWPLAQWQLERRSPPPIVRLEALAPIAGWAPAPQPVAEWRPGYQNSEAILDQSFDSPQRAVGLYLAYYRSQGPRHKMVSSSNALVSSDDIHWVQLASVTPEITLDRQSFRLRSAQLRAVDSTELLAWRWYWVNGRLTGSDYLAKAYTAWSQLSGQGDDSAVIVVYAPNDLAGGAEAALRDFVDAAWPQIDALLRRTRAQR